MQYVPQQKEFNDDTRYLVIYRQSDFDDSATKMYPMYWMLLRSYQIQFVSLESILDGSAPPIDTPFDYLVTGNDFGVYGNQICAYVSTPGYTPGMFRLN